MVEDNPVVPFLTCNWSLTRTDFASYATSFPHVVCESLELGLSLMLAHAFCNTNDGTRQIAPFLTSRSHPLDPLGHSRTNSSGLQQPWLWHARYDPMPETASSPTELRK